MAETPGILEILTLRRMLAPHILAVRVRKFVSGNLSGAARMVARFILGLIRLGTPAALGLAPS